MTRAFFEFDPRHSPAVCEPPPGRIVGILHPDLTGGEYDLEFIAGAGPNCATAAAISPDGGSVAVNTSSSCGAGVQNVSVVIRRRQPPEQRTQLAQPICLA